MFGGDVIILVVNVTLPQWKQKKKKRREEAQKRESECAARQRRDCSDVCAHHHHHPLRHLQQLHDNQKVACRSCTVVSRGVFTPHMKFIARLLVSHATSDITVCDVREMHNAEVNDENRLSSEHLTSYQRCSYWLFIGPKFRLWLSTMEEMSHAQAALTRTSLLTVFLSHH